MEVKDMPDDTSADTSASQVAEQQAGEADEKAEQTEEQVFDAGFDEATADTEDKKKPDAKTEAGTKKEDADKKPDEKKNSAETQDNSEAEDKKDEETSGDEAKKKPEEKPPEKTQEQKQQGVFEAGKYIDGLVDSFPLKEIDMPDGVKFKISEVKEAYPDIFNAIVLMASHIANTHIDQALNSGEIARGRDFAEIRDGILNDKFRSGLNKAYSGADEILDSKEFSTWSAKQPNAISALAKSNKVEDVLYVLKMYDHDNKMAQNQQKKKELLKATLKTSPKIQPDKDNEKDDFDEGWKEANK